MNGDLSSSDGLSDYALTGGAIFDAIMRGVDIKIVHAAWFESDTPLEMEAKLHASSLIALAQWKAKHER